MSLLDIIAVLLVLSAGFGYLNHVFLKLPHTIGLVAIGLAASGAIVLADLAVPGLSIAQSMRDTLNGIDFYAALMHGFLSALLFAGAVHVDLSELAARKWAIGLMATVGILISTFLIGFITYWLAGLLGLDLPLIWALIFGALISPTDPVAVLGILKTVKVPDLLKAKIAGESLFNDGVGIVVFTILLAIATAAPNQVIDASDVAILFIQEALGGAVLGLIAGAIAFYLMRSLDDHMLEVLITLALVSGTYALGIKLHVSGPIAVVIAGLLIGNHGAKLAMSENTRRHIFNFWDLIDEVLNSVLFLLIGLEVLVITFTPQYAWLGLIMIPVVLLVRAVAVSIPIGLLSLRRKFTSGAIRILTWGGLRGGISVALALSLPDTPYKAQLLAATYFIVVFSIIVQGLTMERLVRITVRDTEAEDPKGLQEGAGQGSNTDV